MLSDEKMDRKIREHVKEHPVILPEDYQAMVQEQIKKCCEGEMKKETDCSSLRCIMRWSLWCWWRACWNELCKTACGADL